MHYQNKPAFPQKVSFCIGPKKGSCTCNGFYFVISLYFDLSKNRKGYTQGGKLKKTNKFVNIKAYFLMWRMKNSRFRKKDPPFAKKRWKKGYFQFNLTFSIFLGSRQTNNERPGHQDRASDTTRGSRKNGRIPQARVAHSIFGLTSYKIFYLAITQILLNLE